MGLLNIFKRKPSVKVDITIKADGKTYTDKEFDRELKQKHPNNPAFHRTKKENDLSGAFFSKHFNEIQKRKADLSECYNIALVSDEIDLRIALLHKTLEKYNIFKEWCYKSKGGMIYFQDKYEYLENPDGSLYTKEEQILSDIEHQLYIKNDVIPIILEKADTSDGILQRSFYSLFPDIKKKEIQMIIDEMESAKQIIKIKKGNSYLIKRAFS